MRAKNARQTLKFSHAEDEHSAWQPCRTRSKIKKQLPVVMAVKMLRP